MLQGALDYAMNLVGEVLSMIWEPTQAPQTQSMEAIDEHSSKQEMISLQVDQKACVGGTDGQLRAGRDDARSD